MRFVPLLLTGLMVLPLAAAEKLKPQPPEPLSNAYNGQMPEVSCSNIMSQLKKYNQMARENEFAIADYLTHVADVSNKWYEHLKPLEKRSKGVIEPGYFDPIKKDTGNIYSSVDLVYQNSSYLKRRLQNIMNVLPGCLNQSHVQ